MRRQHVSDREDTRRCRKTTTCCALHYAFACHPTTLGLQLQEPMQMPFARWCVTVVWLQFHFISSTSHRVCRSVCGISPYTCMRSVFVHNHCRTTISDLISVPSSACFLGEAAFRLHLIFRITDRCRAIQQLKRQQTSCRSNDLHTATEKGFLADAECIAKTPL
jgi:hypothetical protein